MTSASDQGAQGHSRNSDRSEPSGLVVLAVVFDPLEAEMILGKLRSARIDAYSRHEALSVVYGLTLDGAGQQEIVVREEDLDEARAALGPVP